MSILLSLVVPMRNEERVLPRFFAAVLPVLESVTADYEVVCVDDGSTDRTLALLRERNAGNPRIKVVALTRNFGKEVALTAGIDHAAGDAVIPFDADLQNPPEIIPEMVEKWREGWQMVTAVLSDRRSDTLVKRLTAVLFYRVFRRVCETEIPINVCDFRLMDREVVDALRRMPERTRFLKGMLGWLGFRQTYVHFKRPRRAAGRSKFSFWRLWNFGLEGIFSFSTLPLRVWSYIGFATAVFGIGYMGLILARTLIYGVDVPGYASLMVVLLFFSGLNMIGLGIFGEYLGRIFVEVKQRPLYLVATRIGFTDTSARDELVYPIRRAGLP